MRKIVKRTALIASLLMLMLSSGAILASPSYDSDQTRMTVEQLIEAHGGLDKWNKAKTLSYDNLFFNPSYEQIGWPSPWWATHEVIDLQKRRAYHDWPLDGAELTFDGDKVWSVDWVQGNPPKFQAMFFFYFLNLPWLTQEENVRLTDAGKGPLPGSDKEYLKVLMEFTEKPTVGKTAQDTFRLYIDPESHQLKAYEYVIGFGAMLDAMGVPEGGLMPPMLRVNDRFAEVDGLVMPTEMHTMAADGSMTFGHHVILNYSFKDRFQESRMRMPTQAKLDTTSSERQSSMGGTD